MAVELLEDEWIYTPPANLAVAAPPQPSPIALAAQVQPFVQSIPPPMLQLTPRASPAGKGVGEPPISADTMKWIVRIVGSGVLGYHGWRRSRGSLPWTAAWALLGAFSPVLGGMIAAAQGFGSRAEE